MAVNLSAVAIVLTLGAFILHVIGLATPYWIYGKSYGITYHYGLWQSCTSYGCSSSFKAADWIKTVRAFTILGVLALLLALLITFLKLRMERTKAVMSILTVLFNLCAAGAILISVAVFAAKHLQLGSLRFHFSFGFEIVAIALSAMGGVINVIDMVQRRQSSFK